MEHLKAKIRTIPDFPKPGIMFRDITTLLKDGEGLRESIDVLAKRYQDQQVDLIAGIESRGFIVGAALATQMGIGFVPVRKPNRLPGETIGIDYELEYGNDRLEIHVDAIPQGSRVLMVDDLIATGGTMNAACHLVENVGGEVVECAFIIELPDLGGRKVLSNYPVFSIVEFEGD